MNLPMENNPEFVTVEKFAKLTEFLGKLSKRLNAIEQSIKGIDQRIEKIEEYLDSGDSEPSEGGHSESENHGFGPKPTQSPRHSSGDSFTVVLSHGPFTIYREEKDDDAEWAKRKKGVLYQRVKFLNCTGVTGTPEQVEYLKELDDIMTRWKQDPRNPENRH